MFIEFKTSDGNNVFALNAFHIVSVCKRYDDCVEITTTDTHNNYITGEKYKDVVEKLSTIQ